MRGVDSLKVVATKKANKPLWKHILEKHGGIMEAPIFSQFKMTLVQFFVKTQRQKGNEGVRIAHLDANTRMNSCDKFLQGTNIFMRPVMGVGI